MIQGNFDNQGKLFFPADLLTKNGELIPIDTLLDTGFTDFLAMNIQDIDDLGWSLLAENQPMQTAQGKTRFNVYEGTIIIDEQEFVIPVLGGNAITEIIMGLPWLETRRLVVDFPSGLLTLG